MTQQNYTLMKQSNRSSGGEGGQTSPRSSSRSIVRILLVLIAIAGVAGVVAKLGLFRGPAPASAPSATEPGQAATQHEPADAAATRPTAQPAVKTSTPKASVPALSTPNAPAEPSPASSGAAAQLVSSLMNPDQFAGGVTPELATAWRDQLAALAKVGPSAIPAIRELLSKGADLNFGAGGVSAVGYVTARSAMLDVLGAIGGSEAHELLKETLSSTADPREIAFAARSLEAIDPNEAGEGAVHAALQALQAAAKDGVKDKDVGPLFEVLQRYGGADIAPELEKMSAQWNYYSAMSLAQLPDGAGIPTLAKMADEQQGMAPLQMLAQMATQFPEAKTALMGLAENNKIPASAWAYLEAALSGDRFHFSDSVLDPTVASVDAKEIKTSTIVAGNQNFYKAPDTTLFTPDYVNQQVAMIDQLLKVTKDPSAAQYLERARAALSARMATLPSQPPK